MTDISVESRAFAPDDRQWLLFEAVGHQQPVATTHGVLNFALFTAGTHYPNGYIPSGVLLGKVGADNRLGPYGGRTNEVQTVNLGAATAGTVTITVDGETTSALAFNATTAAVQAALEALSNVGPGDIVVTGGPLPGAITLTFGGRYRGVNVAAVTVTPTGLTGGTVTVATTTAGGSTVSDGRETPVGFLYNAISVPANQATKVAAAIVDSFAVVDVTKLPTGNGLDAAARAELPLIKFRG